MRNPISRLRRITEYARMAYNPMLAKPSASSPKSRAVQPRYVPQTNLDREFSILSEHPPKIYEEPAHGQLAEPGAEWCVDLLSSVHTASSRPKSSVPAERRRTTARALRG